MSQNEGARNKKNGENVDKSLDSLKFSHRCMSFKEFQEMQKTVTEPDLSNEGNPMQSKNNKSN